MVVAVVDVVDDAGDVVAAAVVVYHKRFVRISRFYSWQERLRRLVVAAIDAVVGVAGAVVAEVEVVDDEVPDCLSCLGCLDNSSSICLDCCPWRRYRPN